MDCQELGIPVATSPPSATASSTNNNGQSVHNPDFLSCQIFYFLHMTKDGNETFFIRVWKLLPN